MLAHFRLPPLLLPLCCFICGLAVAGSFGLFLPDYLLPLSLLLSVPLLFIGSSPPFVASLCLTLLVTGNLLLTPLLKPSPQDQLTIEQHLKDSLTLEGVIVKRPEVKDGGCKILMRPEHIFTAGRRIERPALEGLLLLKVGISSNIFFSGDRIRFQGKLKAPRNFGTAGEFDAERFYALKGIAATTFVKSDADILLVRQGVESGFQRHFDQTAAKIGRFIMTELPGVEGGVMKALLIGDMADIPQEVKDAYSRTGVNHILSISGFHVGIIALVLFQLWFAVSRIFPATLLYLNFRRFAQATSIPLIIYYMFLSGAAPATARSVLMLGLLTIALMLERETDAVNSLALAAFALLLINPANLYDISFQLSFLSLWGITVITPLLAGCFATTARGWRYNISLFTCASIAAVTVTLLPVAYYFQQSSLTGIISNFFIVPLLGYGAVVTGFSALPFIWLSPVIAGYLLKTAGFLTTASNRTIALLDKIPTLPLYIPTTAEIIIFLLALLFITIIRNNRSKTLTILSVPLLLVSLHQTPANDDDYALRMDFLSVGQGESTLITFADKRRMLIDGGGALHEGGWDIGKQLLLPTLKRLGVQRIDYLVLSHSHPDHLQGVVAVAAELPIGEFWESGLNSGEEYRKLMKILEQRKIPVKKITNAATDMEISGVTVRCLHPFSGEDQGAADNDMNETSLVLRFSSGKLSALFTGDIGFTTELKLLKNRDSLSSTLLKVPHHGSRYSSSQEFITAVSPKIAVISAGYNNSFGLPAAETLQQLSIKRISIFRTDLDGTITALFPNKGEELRISAFKRQMH